MKLHFSLSNGRPFTSFTGAIHCAFLFMAQATSKVVSQRFMLQRLSCPLHSLRDSVRELAAQFRLGLRGEVHAIRGEWQAKCVDPNYVAGR